MIRRQEGGLSLPARFTLFRRTRWGRSGIHRAAGHPRQSVDDLFRETVAEVLVIGVSAQIGKRQHSDRRSYIGARLRQVLQGVPDVGHRLEPAAGIWQMCGWLITAMARVSL